MKFALVSLDQAWENKIENKHKVIYVLEKIKNTQADPDLIVFPEMTLTGFTMNEALLSENPENSDTIKFFAELSKKYNQNIAFGVILKKNDKSTNNLIIVTPEGHIGNYEKIHPFSFSGEDLHYIGGNSLGISSLKNVNIGLTICYDLRFPEIFQALSKTCEIIINIANWPEKRVDHWLTLLKARAIENQSFLIGVNRTGIDANGISFIKSSKVFSPLGTELQPFQQIENIDFYELNRNETKQIRESFPLKKDRKIELYKNIL